MLDFHFSTALNSFPRFGFLFYYTAPFVLRSFGSAVSAAWWPVVDLLRLDRLRGRHAIWPQDAEPVQRLAPVLYWHGPFFRCVPQGQVQQLERRLVVRKRASHLDDFPQRHVQRLNRV